MTIASLTMKKILKMLFNDQNFNENGGDVSKFRAKGHYNASKVYKRWRGL